MNPCDEGAPVLAAVISDLRSRAAAGNERYGGPMLPHDGRDTLREAYEEALDLAMYLGQSLLEREPQILGAPGAPPIDRRLFARAGFSFLRVSSRGNIWRRIRG